MPPETIYVVAAIIKNNKNEYLITQRMPNARYGGYWEFPGGTVEKGEAPGGEAHQGENIVIFDRKQ